jgi:hypothetical protein
MKVIQPFYGINTCEPTLTTPNHKPDIKIRDNENETCVIIDIVISGCRNLIKKEANTILNTKTLSQKNRACRTQAQERYP